MKMEQLQFETSNLTSEIGYLALEGKKFHDERNFTEAIKCYDKAYQLSRELNVDEVERTCAFNLGAVFIAEGQVETGLSYLHKATPPEGQSDARCNGDLYFNIGLGQEKLGDEAKALENYEKAFKRYKAYESGNTELLNQCFDKCVYLFVKWKRHVDASRLCQEMADVYDMNNDHLHRAEKLCEKADYLRRGTGVEQGDILKAAEECMNVINSSHPQGTDCHLAGKVLNDLGLVFTQVQEYNHATTCFEKAHEMIQMSHTSNNQLRAVILQNLGAAYNFTCDFQRAIKYHEDAADIYAKIKYRNGQGQCYTNLAFAHSQLGNMKDAEVAFNHALLAAKDTDDKHMKWQAFEGLGAVNFNMGELKRAQKYFISALKNVENNPVSQDRIETKLEQVIQAEVSGFVPMSGRYSSRPGSVQGVPVSQAAHLGYMQTHGPPEEHTQMGSTPRSLSALEQQIIPRHADRMLLAAPPAMSRIQEQQKPRHSPNTSPVKWDNNTEPKRGPVNDHKIQEIFAKRAEIVKTSTTSVQHNLTPVKEDDSLMKYRKAIEERDEEEDTSESDSNSETTDSSSSEIDGDGDDDVDHVNQAQLGQIQRPPPPPTQSPLHTGTQGTYLQPAYKHINSDYPSFPHSDGQQPTTTPVRQSTEDSSEDSEGSDPIEKDDDPSYASIKSVNEKHQHPPSSAGNDHNKGRRKESRIRSQNFFESESTQSDGSDPQSGRYRGDDIIRKMEGMSSHADVSGLEKMPRGQREQFLLHEHQRRQQAETPPDLPPRQTEGNIKSKGCVIM
ncbi:tetratricopeptide repeat protein 24-like isoform X4 [Mya arenaria]|uniref:tetratricopeptide repeat protein 24-like isoform X4 n=1 Tax=Mya arenaria TaxID=6604 RepID=UPI0022DFA94F|nr:tetratricopeptide repeat protein 24-like isoform X4 [Mya arenaria]